MLMMMTMMKMRKSAHLGDCNDLWQGIIICGSRWPPSRISAAYPLLPTGSRTTHKAEA